MCDYFSRFPQGSCGNASDILGKWLGELGMHNVEYVYGMRDKTSHGWIECNGFIIDITSDQFKDGLGDIYVGSENAFHSTFSNQKRSVPDLAPVLLHVYEDMRKYLKVRDS